MYFISENLKFDEHVDTTVNKMNRIMGIYGQRSVLTLYKSHLDYGNLVFYPTTKKYKQTLDNVQGKALRLVPELRGLI